MSQLDDKKYKSMNEKIKYVKKKIYKKQPI